MMTAKWRRKWRRAVSNFNRSCILTNPLCIMTFNAPKGSKISVLSPYIFCIATKKKWDVPLICNYYAVSESPQLPKLTRLPNFNFEIRTLEFSTAITVQAVHSFFVNMHMRTIRFDVDNGTKRQQTKGVHNNGTRAIWSSDAILMTSPYRQFWLFLGLSLFNIYRYLNVTLCAC